MIKAAIFDMDGLLIDSEPFWRRSQKIVLPSLGIPVRDEMFEQFMGKRIDEVVASLYHQYPWDGPTCKEVEQLIVDHVIQLIHKDGRALPGVVSTLELLNKKGIKLALASSSGISIINTVLHKLELSKFFQIVHSAQDETYGKPHPQVFISTAQKLGIMCSECVVFEDSFNGVIAALAANMRCIAVPDSELVDVSKFNMAHLTLNSLEEFKMEYLHEPSVYALLK